MASKTTPVTTRLTQEDQDFLSRLQLGGATTISEKLRELIAEERLRQAARKDFASALTMVDRLLEGATTAVHVAEKSTKQHSQLVRRVLEWLPDTVAVALAESPAPDDNAPEAAIRRLEEELSIRVLRLMEAVLQAALNPESSLYEPALLDAARLAPVLKIAELIGTRNNNSERSKP